MSLRVILVDDEPLARERLRSLLEAEADVELVAECTDGVEAVAAVRSGRPDLVFLDVQMPGMDGFEVLDALDPATLPAVVFVTAYDRYALKAFDVHAVDYLLKPFDRQRFSSALERARLDLRADDAGRRILALVADLRRERRPQQRIVVKAAGRVFFLRPAEIDWMEAAGNYVRLHVGKKSHLVRETMKGLEDRLDPDTFVRIHRSRIVNLDRVRELQPWFHGEHLIVLTSGEQLTTSRRHSVRLQELLESRR
ncbi:MAG TPA: response regulator [Gemmatimonadota bacterium]|nr:response regulator [Gemmatimonadota bacterium]